MGIGNEKILEVEKIKNATTNLLINIRILMDAIDTNCDEFVATAEASMEKIEKVTVEKKQSEDEFAETVKALGEMPMHDATKVISGILCNFNNRILKLEVSSRENKMFVSKGLLDALAKAIDNDRKYNSMVECKVDGRLDALESIISNYDKEYAMLKSKAYRIEEDLKGLNIAVRTKFTAIEKRIDKMDEVIDILECRK